MLRIPILRLAIGLELITRTVRYGFVGFHVVAIFSLALPLQVFPISKVRESVVPYMRGVGLNETWDTFAPSPKNTEQFFKAIVVTRANETRVFSFPRMEYLTFYERYRKERYRKFTESLVCKECSGLWPDVEKEVARRTLVETDLPARVILVKFESPIDPRTNATGDETHAVPTVLSALSINSGDLQ